MRNNHKIPKLLHAFFRWYCRKEMYEELHGDLEEFYYERVEEYGIRKARFYYFMDVVRCCQPYAWRNSQGQNSNIIMFRNYYKTFIRSLMKNPLSSLINLFGLSAAIGICIVAYAFNAYTYKIDGFHENLDQLYLVTFFADRDGSLQENGQIPMPMGRMLKEDFAQIQSVCRLDEASVVMKYNDKIFHERVQYADPEFLEMFSFPLKWGSTNSLKDLNSVILSEEMAIKYFGDQNPIDKTIRMIFDENVSKVFKISGVAMEFPGSRSFSFDMLINFENLSTTSNHNQLADWDSYTSATFIQVEESSDITGIVEGMDKYRDLQNEAIADWNIDSFSLEPLTTLYQNSANIRNDIAGDGFKVLYNSAISFVIIGFFVLVLASTNYINIAIVSATKRLKEIGLRKVIGASKRMVIVQFLAENFLVMLFALLIGIVVGVNVFIPWLEQNSNFNMDFELLDKRLWIFLPLVLIFTALVSGAYPALYVSRFHAAAIFKGSFKLGTKSRLTQVFLGFQLILACVLISIAVFFTQNNRYQSERSWGYDKHEVLYVKVPDKSGYKQFYSVMAQNPNVTSISASGHHLGRNHDLTEIEMPDRNFEVQQMAIDTNYLNTMGIELISGRSFRNHQTSDMEAVLVNETLIKDLAIHEPIGQQFKIDSLRFTIIGVVKDFHTYNFYLKVKPTILKLAQDKEYQYICMRVRKGTEMETNQALQTHWATLFPEIPFNGGYQEDVWGNFYENMGQGVRFWWGLATIVILIASLGLYGVVTLNVSGRIREFSIRKVLGADTKSIANNISRQYYLVFLVALIIGGPVSYYLVQTIFDTFFVYHMPMNFTFFIFTGGVLISILLLVVITQIQRVFKSNPVDGLKVE